MCLAIIIFVDSSLWADVSGFEHLSEIAIDCGKAPVDAVKPHTIKNRFICSYENRLCKVLNKGELQFEAYISVDCEVKAATDSCPTISTCAKPNQLSPAVAEEIRRLNDPNFSSSPDGAAVSSEMEDKIERQRKR
jgi:hypothetical protein